ncbi:MAG: hypothetical protein QGI09_00025 [Dehalococcoidia bacterium]|jgi:hypothetical protein|nr:hypothetical protein [Dehalococcoidia bacterium]
MLKYLRDLQLVLASSVGAFVIGVLTYRWALDTTARCGGTTGVIRCNADWLATITFTLVGIIIGVFLGAMALAALRALNRITD